MPVQSISPDTRAIADLLKATSIGDTATFSAMSAAIGRDIRARRHLIPRALTLASQEAGAVFGTLRGEGYRRLPAEDAHLLGAHARRRIRRTAKRTAELITSAATMANDLSDPARRRAFAEINALGLIRHLASDKAVSATHAAEPKAEPVALLMRRAARHLGAID